MVPEDVPLGDSAGLAMSVRQMVDGKRPSCCDFRQS